MNEIQKAKEIIEKSKKIVIITGAGISQESGIPTFRGVGGLWKKYRAEELATYEAFKKNPELVWKFYDYRRQIIAKAKPNEGHKILAKAEKRFDSFYIITQNIDGLHRKAGSKNVLELHGNIWRVRCEREKKTFEYRQNPMTSIPPECPVCGNILRPDVVWFGESLPKDVLEKSYHLSSNADVAIVVGTSSIVYPAAHLPYITKQNGGKLIEINIKTTPLTDIADIHLKGKSSEILKQIFE